MTVRELNRDQIDELKGAFFWSDDPETQEYLDHAGIIDPEEIPDSVIFDYFGHVHFVPDDFAGTAWNGSGTLPHTLPF